MKISKIIKNDIEFSNMIKKFEQFKLSKVFIFLTEEKCSKIRRNLECKIDIINIPHSKFQTLKKSENSIISNNPVVTVIIYDLPEYSHALLLNQYNYDFRYTRIAVINNKKRSFINLSYTNCYKWFYLITDNKKTQNEIATIYNC